MAYLPKLRPGDEVFIAFKSGSVHGGMTLGTVTVVSVDPDRFEARWPGDQRTYWYRFDEIEIREHYDAIRDTDH